VYHSTSAVGINPNVMLTVSKISRVSQNKPKQKQKKKKKKIKRPPPSWYNGAVRDDVLDSLMLRWYRWVQSEETTQGYPSECPSCRRYVTSRQYDDANGALDDDLDHREMHAVDRAMHSLPPGYLTVLSANAAALSVKWEITEYPAAVLEARRALWKRLAIEGVVS
jgi:hypothetical protein